MYTMTETSNKPQFIYFARQIIKLDVINLFYRLTESDAENSYTIRVLVDKHKFDYLNPTNKECFPTEEERNKRFDELKEMLCG